MQRLHAYLSDPARSPTRWQLTIVDNASTDRTGEIAARLAGRLRGVSAVRLAEHHDRRSLRRAWASSPAGAVAFLDIGPTSDLDALLGPLDAHLPPSRDPGDGEPAGAGRAVGDGLAAALRTPMDRRTAVAGIVAAALGAILAACGGKQSSSAPSATPAGAGSTRASGSPGAASSGGAQCVLAAEMTEGPYYLDLNLVRSDIAEDREGAPLALELRVVDATTCAPIEGAAVDIWHADAGGLYSGFVSASSAANSSGGPAEGGGAGGQSASDESTFLRGTQLSDAEGAVTLQTIYPGWSRDARFTSISRSTSRAPRSTPASCSSTTSSPMPSTRAPLRTRSGGSGTPGTRTTTSTRTAATSRP